MQAVGAGAPKARWEPATAEALAAQLDDSLPFSFVTDPVGRFVGGVEESGRLRRPPVRGSDVAGVLQLFDESLAWLANSSTSSPPPEAADRRMDIHLRPQLAFMYLAGWASTQHARARARAAGLPEPRYAPPLKFVGRLIGESAEQDWQGLRAALARAYGPDVARRVNSTLGRENDSSPRKLAFAAALGDRARAATMPRDLARRLCTALHAEFVCLQLPWPHQCLDAQGRYDVPDMSGLVTV